MLRSGTLRLAGVMHACRYWSLAAVAGAAVLLTGHGGWAADESFTARSASTLPGGQKITSFDLSFVDSVIGLYLLADRTNNAVDVIDTTTNAVLVQLGKGHFVGVATSCPSANLNRCSGPNGVLTVDHREVWAGDGDSTIKVVNLFSQQITHTIPTGGTLRTNEGCYDPRDHVFLTGNSGDLTLTPPLLPFLSVVSTDNYSILQTIVMDGTMAPGGGVPTPKATNDIDACQWDPRTGNFYVNIPEVNGPGNDSVAGAVVVISPKPDTFGKIEAVWTIPADQCLGPQGMAVGPDHQILLGCNDPTHTVPSTVIIDDRTGAVIATLPNEDGADQVWYNAGDGQYFLARGGGANPQKLGIVDADADSGRLDQDVTTGLPNTPASPHGTAHSVAADPIFNQVYVPIPSTAGGTVCSNAGASDAQGCIAVFTAAHDDPPIPLRPHPRRRK
jgi:hypothetical protein